MPALALRVCSILFCLTLSTPPVFAAEWYVSPTGNDASAGTLAAPLLVSCGVEQVSWDQRRQRLERRHWNAACFSGSSCRQRPQPRPYPATTVERGHEAFQVSWQ